MVFFHIEIVSDQSSTDMDTRIKRIENGFENYKMIYVER